MSNKFTIKYKDFALSVRLSENNIHIEDSFKIIDKTIMSIMLNKIVKKAIEEGYSYKRSIKSWINEWVAHNYLYNKNKHIDSTKSVDLNDDESFFKRLGYWFISNFLY